MFRLVLDAIMRKRHFRATCGLNKNESVLSLVMKVIIKFQVLSNFYSIPLPYGLKL